MKLLPRMVLSSCAFLWWACAGLICAGSWPAEADSTPVRVLLISGQNNHRWQETTPLLKAFPEEAGTVRVRILESPAKLTPADLEETDVLLSNWNSFSEKAGVREWPESVRIAYAEFVRNGGGHVVVHAGSSSFYDWDDYFAIGLMRWKTGRTSHGKQHTFPIRVEEAAHPVMEGFRPGSVRDELWERPEIHPDATVLASSLSARSDGGAGTWEPCVLAGRFGKGRCFTTTLGHDVQSLSQPAVQELVRRGVHWAAAKPVFEVVERPESISLRVAGRPLWTFNHRPAEGKPYFHPLATTLGQNFTDLRPADHFWHRGLWFSWKYLNGVNYWEENRETLRSEGETCLLEVACTVLPDQRVRVEMQFAYAPGTNAGVILEESRKVLIHSPATNGAYRVDWSSAFTARNRVELDRTPLPHQPNGKSWGGYAGYSLRMNKEVIGGTFTNSEGQTGGEAQRQPAQWMIYAAPRGGSVLFLDHPDNFSYPTKWYFVADMPWFSPALIHDAPRVLESGQTLRLHYRLVIHPSTIDSRLAQEEWSSWTRDAAREK